MAWTTPSTWTAGQVVSASDMNAQVRDNMTYLLSGRQYTASVFVGSSDPSTTSTTFADVDATNAKVSITPKSSRAWVSFIFHGGNASGTSGSEWDIYSVTAAARLGHATHGISNVGVNRISSHTTSYPATGLTPSSANDFKLQHRSTVAGQTTTTFMNAWPMALMVKEF